MLKGLDIVALANKIEAQKGEKRDFVIDTRKMEMVVKEDGWIAGTDAGVAKSLQLVVDDKGAFPILPLAHNQIGSRLNIPSKYYDRMASDAPSLLCDNVNHWFRDKPETRMVRTLAGSDRAFLSNRYQRIENEMIAEAALPVLYDLPGVQIPSCEVTDRRLYIHFVIPTIEGEVKKGDIVQAGGVIQNSEVGLGSVSVSGLVWRLVCLNGMKTADAFRRNHVGRQIEEGEELDWSDDTRKADDTTVLLKVRDMVRAVVDETRFRVNLAKLQGLSTATITGDPLQTVELVSEKIGATEGEKSSILRALIEGADLSAWGVVNAVTGLAHKAASYDRAVELEAAGGALIDLPSTEWRRVLEAA
jgi:hypothetical protein